MGNLMLYPELLRGIFVVAFEDRRASRRWPPILSASPAVVCFGCSRSSFFLLQEQLANWNELRVVGLMERKPSLGQMRQHLALPLSIRTLLAIVENEGSDLGLQVRLEGPSARPADRWE